ncbi:nucleotidyltransferase family protein [Listeria booriae]|uniref:nucleotidyltransferase family protein n=1 Tax=Listeria booriae TaxID=1552123 RepID=UPI0016296360|nr:nucleotidyltransferase family protein [Listeria booriae]MBC1513578.1 nucleotidyltransferase family protein [Listeria booriae]MBC6152549.1 nucleotidyltransferase family protein [Listeria booriae]MBC6306854.1 nucleotidyltransferase family protein [Listeria booriae]
MTYSSILTREEYLLILSCSNADLNKDALDKLVRSKLDWDFIFLSGIKHKVLFTVYFNLNKYGLLDTALNKGNLPLILLNHWKQLHYINLNRNQLILSESAKLESYFAKNNILCCITKGGPRLIGDIYDIEERKMYDIDFIGNKEDYYNIDEILKKQGYDHKSYEFKTNELKETDKEDIKKWLLLTRGLPNYVKHMENLSNDLFIVQLQFRFGSANDNKHIKANDLLSRISIKNNAFFIPTEVVAIQLASHIHRETTEREFDDWNMNWNLVKFLDFQRYIDKYFTTELQWNELFKIAESINYTNELLYSVFYTKSIFQSKNLELVYSYLDSNNSNDRYHLLSSEFALKQISKVSKSNFKPSKKWDGFMGSRST